MTDTQHQGICGWRWLTWCRERLFSIQWVPSHMDIHGNQGADKLAAEGRQRHQGNLVEWAGAQ